jgi:deoxyribodipyrimidine photolyase-like uncharacterized protein
LVNPRLILVLGDQLTDGISALKAADKSRDLVVMAEVMGEAASTEHHPQKIAMVLTAMRKFALHLREQGWNLAYSRLDDPRKYAIYFWRIAALCCAAWRRFCHRYKMRRVAASGRIG